VGGVNKWDEAGDAVRSVIRAYHGSGADFNKFDSGKIGTGEGSQAYGHGLYFAGHEPVAQRYRDMLAFDAPYTSPEQAAAEYLAANGGDAPSTLKVLGMHASQPGQYGYTSSDQQDIIRKARELVESGVPITPRERTGHMYEVEIGYPEEALLDLDAPATGEHKAAMLGAAFEAPDNKWQRMAVNEIADRGARAKIATESLLRAYNSITDNPMLSRAASAAKVSESLLRHGIPGARYFDKSSRAAGTGTRNYVVFPGAEDSIRILRKYAIPGAVGTGVASQYEESP
jgi:hypothetical protein